jgi:hypothetical protein
VAFFSQVLAVATPSLKRRAQSDDIRPMSWQKAQSTAAP